MRSTLSALVVAAGLLGFGAAAQATPLAASMPLGVAADSGVVHVQMTPGERRMMRHRMMRHRMMRHDRRMMRHRMMQHRMMRHERRMMRHGM